MVPTPFAKVFNLLTRFPHLRVTVILWLIAKARPGEPQVTNVVQSLSSPPKQRLVVYCLVNAQANELLDKRSASKLLEKRSVLQT